MVLNFSTAEILSVAVGVLCVLVTILIGWNITEVIRARSYRKSLDRKMNEVIKDYKNYTDANISMALASIALGAPKKTTISAIEYVLEALDSLSEVKNVEGKEKMNYFLFTMIKETIKRNPDLQIPDELKERALEVSNKTIFKEELINLISRR